MKVVITGASGRMGAELIKLVGTGDYQTFKLIGAVVSQDSKKLGEVASGDVRYTRELANLITQADAVIDFSKAEIAVEFARICKEYKKIFVSGTTGLSEKEMAELKQIANEIPVFYSANMCFSTYAFAKNASTLAAQLKGYEVEIMEIHHNQKVDAPSGTALMIGKMIAEARGVEFIPETNRHGQKKNPNSIGFASLRMGSVVGEHSVYLIKGAERIELKHVIADRSAFASGALDALNWIKQSQKQAGFFNMQSIFG